MSCGTILIIDDDPRFLSELRSSLIASGYAVVEAFTSDEALRKFREDAPNLVLLGMEFSKTGDFDLCREIRRGTEVPIIVLAESGGQQGQVTALDAGADSCVMRSVGILELLARIGAALRRGGHVENRPPLEFRDLTIDLARRAVFVRGERRHLTPKEFGLLSLLVRNLGKPMPHRRLLQVVWGPDYGDEPEYLRVQIYELRKKIEPNPSKPKYIRTEPRFGYRFESNAVGPKVRKTRSERPSSRLRIGSGALKNRCTA